MESIFKACPNPDVLKDNPKIINKQAFNNAFPK
jgi:hypothetical protein